ncbi:hypothetical protein BS78_02G327500 [Paspalum vaginatum]|nr:hypothetical protein BS78_02G327500 [Paspalum vaginatum]
MSAGAAAASFLHRHRSAAVASPSCTCRRVRANNIVPAACLECAHDLAAASRRPSDQEPRGTTMKASPAVNRRRRRRDGGHGASSPARKRRRRGREIDASRSESSYYRDGGDRDDDAHGARAAKRKEEGRERGRAREDSRRSGGERSDKRRATTQAFPSGVEDRKESPPVQKATEEAEARCRRDDIQRQREEARRELDKVVRTVWFNDPYISPQCAQHDAKVVRVQVA